MNCKEFVDFLMAYCDGELEPKLRASFDRHVGDCPPCMHYLDGYKKVGDAARTACGHEHSAQPMGPVPEALVAAILAARCEVSGESES